MTEIVNIVHSVRLRVN